MIVNIKKRYAYAIICLLVLSVGVFIVYALAPGIDTSQGYHESEQISVSVSGTEKTLQEAIDDKSLGGNIPSGAIMAFDLVGCPSGWSELVSARGRVIVGLNPSDGSFNSRGETGGAKTHTLTIAEMPSHRHTNYDRGHYTHGTCNSGGSVCGIVSTSYSSYEGGNQPHNNLQPYISFIYCKKN